MPIRPLAALALTAALSLVISATVIAEEGSVVGSANAGSAAESASGTDGNIATTSGRLPSNLPGLNLMPSPDAVAPGPPPIADTPVSTPAPAVVGTNAIATESEGSINLGGTSTAGVGGASACGYATWFDAQMAMEKDPSLAATLDPDGNGIACEEAM